MPENSPDPQRESATEDNKTRETGDDFTAWANEAVRQEAEETRRIQKSPMWTQPDPLEGPAGLAAGVESLSSSEVRAEVPSEADEDFTSWAESAVRQEAEETRRIQESPMWLQDDVPGVELPSTPDSSKDDEGGS